jgi:hypothetical protein
MVALGLRIRRLGDLLRCMLVFVVLGAVSGGGVYMMTGSGTRLTLGSLWIVPVMMGALYVTVYLWQRWHKTDEFIQQVMYKVKLEFGWGSVEIPALLDTGNELKDPVTGAPIIVVEENAIRHVLPPAVRRFLESDWQKESNPWPLLWQSQELAPIMAFVATESIGGKRLLPAIRPQSISIRAIGSAPPGCQDKPKGEARMDGSNAAETYGVNPKPFKKKAGNTTLPAGATVSKAAHSQAVPAEAIASHHSTSDTTTSTTTNDRKATVLLVNQVLSAENRYQALLHPQFVIPSGRNSGYVAQEKNQMLLGKAQERMRREMA